MDLHFFPPLEKTPWRGARFNDTYQFVDRCSISQSIAMHFKNISEFYIALHLIVDLIGHFKEKDLRSLRSKLHTFYDDNTNGFSKARNGYILRTSSLLPTSWPLHYHLGSLQKTSSGM